MKKVLLIVSLVSFSFGLFAQINGTPTYPVSSTSSNPIYFYLESAFNGTALGWTADLRGNLMLSPAASGKGQYNLISNISNKDLALFTLEGNLLKNKSTGLMLTGSHSFDATGSLLEHKVIAGMQHAIKSQNSTSFTVAWKNNLLDRLSSDFLVKDGATAWYFLFPNNNLQLAITNATNLLANTTEGTGAGQYSATVRTNLNNALSAAQNNLNDGNTSNDEQGTIDLNNAMVTYLTTAELQSRINIMTNLANSVTVGNDFGQYAQSDLDTFFAAITTATNIKDNPQSSSSDISNAITSLETAKSAFIATIKSNTALLTSTTPGVIRWYKIISNATNFPQILSNAISQGTRAVGSPFMHETQADPVTDVELFRFEPTANEPTKVNAIVCKTGTYINTTVTASSTANTPTVISATDPAKVFQILPLSDGVSFVINDASVALGSWGALKASTSDTFDLLTGNGGVGSDCAWLIKFVSESGTTGVENLNATDYNVFVKDNVIVVPDTNDYQVYNISGQKVDKNKQLSEGVYLVNVRNFVKKVLIK